jgi:hypothetical protein
MFGVNLSPAWGAVLAVALLFGVLAITHVVNLRIGE